MKKGIIVAIIIIIIAGLAGYRILKLNKIENINNRPIDAQQNYQPAIEPEKLKNEYKSSVKEILSEFLVSPPSSEITLDEIKKNILDLTVPFECKDLHLNLVITLDSMIAGGLEGDQAKIEEGLEKLIKLEQEL